MELIRRRSAASLTAGRAHRELAKYLAEVPAIFWRDLRVLERAERVLLGLSIAERAAAGPRGAGRPGTQGVHHPPTGLVRPNA